MYTRIIYIHIHLLNMYTYITLHVQDFKRLSTYSGSCDPSLEAAKDKRASLRRECLPGAGRLQPGLEPASNPRPRTSDPS